jgi:hypothetical protein
VIDRRLLIVFAILVACKPAPKPVKPGAGPQVNATVVSIRMTIGKQVTNHEIVIANGRARNTVEQDVWRLYDLKARTVTFVDDIDRTVRVEPLPSLLAKRQKLMAGVLPSHFPTAKLTRGETKAILGVPAQQHRIEAGAYRRELWLARHRAIPDDLFVMMIASDTPSSPAAPMMRTVDEELLRTRGFPMLDRAEVPLTNATNVVERAVVGIASRPVPEAMLTVPAGYRDVTPKPQPSKKAAAR